MITAARRAVIVLATVGLVATTSGCVKHGLLFSQDRRIEIVSPERNNATVALPLTVRWSLSGDAHVGRDIGSFAVLFDIEPQPVDETLGYFARRDTVCQRTPGCPDTTYFAQRGVYVTKDTSFKIDDLLPATGVNLDKGDHDRHDVTIIVLDAEGRRVTEASWSRTFEILHPERDK